MERQVAQLVTRVLSNKEPPPTAGLPRTVAFQLRNVLSRTGVSSRGELARLGLATLSADQAAPAV